MRRDLCKQAESLSFHERLLKQPNFAKLMNSPGSFKSNFAIKTGMVSIQNLGPSIIMWCQCDIQIDSNFWIL